MTSRTSLGVALGAMTLLVGVASAGAQETGGVKIYGTVTKSTVVGHSANIARGNGARAHTSIGSIGNGVRIHGDLDMSVQVDEVATIADQPGEQATTSIGSIHPGAEITGRREVVVSTGKVVNLGEGDRPACVIIGSMGAIPGC